jgi:hypothetical protein
MAGIYDRNRSGRCRFVTDAKGPPTVDALIETVIEALTADNLTQAETCA